MNCTLNWSLILGGNDPLYHSIGFNNADSLEIGNRPIVSKYAPGWSQTRLGLGKRSSIRWLHFTITRCSNCSSDPL